MKRREAPERYEQLIAFLGSNLPKPVARQEDADGSLQFTGGDPPEVVVVLTDSSVIVSEFVGVWDNSDANPQNPDPGAWCRWGPRTVDEMFGATVFYTPERKLPVPIRVERGRAVGPAVADAAPFRREGAGATQEPDPDGREP